MMLLYVSYIIILGLSNYYACKIGIRAGLRAGNHLTLCALHEQGFIEYEDYNK